MIEYVIITGIGCCSVASVLIAKMWLKPDNYAGKLKKNMDRYVAELEDDNKHLVKTINAMKKGARIDEKDLDNPIDAIQSLIPQFEHLVPAKFKPFLRDPKLMEYAATIIKENPDAAKKMLSNFVGKAGKGNKDLATLGEDTDESAKISV